MAVQPEMRCEVENDIQQDDKAEVMTSKECLEMSGHNMNGRVVPEHSMCVSSRSVPENEDRVRMITDAERAELERHAKYLANVRTMAAASMKEQSDGMSRFREGVVLVESEKLIAAVGRNLMYGLRRRS